MESFNGRAIPISNNQAIKTYDLQFTAKFLSPDLFQLPQQGNVLFNWNNPELAVTKGEAKVSWQGADGQLNVQDLTANSPLFGCAFRLHQRRFGYFMGEILLDLRQLSTD